MLYLHIVKKIAAILLLAMLVFNWGGHRLLTDYLETRADAQLRSQLDKSDYSEQDLIYLKIVAPLPYGTNSETFERVDGNIVINGVNYSYVKRRFYKDSLELACIPNTIKTGIQNARDEFFKLAYDLTHAPQGAKKQGANSLAFKFLTTEYFNQDNEWHLCPFNPASECTFTDRAVGTIQCFLPVAEQPPDIA